MPALHYHRKKNGLRIQDWRDIYGDYTEAMSAWATFFSPCFLPDKTIGGLSNIQGPPPPPSHPRPNRQLTNYATCQCGPKCQDVEELNVQYSKGAKTSLSRICVTGIEPTPAHSLPYTSHPFSNFYYHYWPGNPSSSFFQLNYGNTDEQQQQQNKTLD